MFINNCSNENLETITSYINQFTEKFTAIEKVDKNQLLVESLKSNLGLAILIWLAGTTIIGIPVVWGLILFRGFCLGYTVSAMAFALGTWKGIEFCMLGLLLQNILFIPALLTMGVSGIKLYKAIVNDRRKENIKIEVVRHTIMSSLMMGVFALASILECGVSVELLKICI